MPADEHNKSLDDVAVAEGRDAGNWARLISELHLTHEIPADAVNLNVEGRRLNLPTHGFGKLWRKTYRVALGEGLTPEDVIATWKREFPRFWPDKNLFYGPVTGVAPGGVGLINITVPGRLRVSTGVLVLYADDISFTFVTPEGHQFAGLITFSAEESDAGVVAQIEALVRANDPIWEMGMPIAIARMEDRFWLRTLETLARHFGSDAKATAETVCIDRRRQWGYWKNLRHNALVRSAAYAAGAPVRALRRR